MHHIQNQRYLSSQDKILQSTLALLETEDSKKITISLICKKANINRSTFYSYYKSFNDLLAKLEADLTQKLVTIYFHDVEFSREFFRSNDFLLTFLRFIRDHQSFVRFYLENKQDFSTASSFPFLWDKIAIPFAKQNNIDIDDELMYYFIFFQTGSFMLIKHWLSTSCKESPEQLTQIIKNCLLRDFSSKLAT